MNDQPNPAEFALAMYATACESHMRRDWREACHALAKALRQELESSASLRALATAAPAKNGVYISPAARAAAKALTPAKPRAVKATAGHFDMTAGSLTTALRMLAKVSPARSTIPILSTVLMQAAGDVLTLTCSDMDKVLAVDVTAPGIGTWQAAPDVRAVLAMVAKAPKGELVTIYPNETGIGLTVAGIVRALPGLAPADFPTLETGELYPLELDGAEIVEALRFVSPAMSTEETRFYLNGAYLARPMVNGAHRLHVVATDGHRLHRWEGEPLDAKPGALIAESPVGAILVPRDTVKAILAMGGDGAGLTMAGNAKHVTVTAGPVRLTSRLIDGPFPDYMRVIPTSHAYTMTAGRAGLASAVANVATILVTDSRPVRLTLNHAAGSLALEARDMEGGKAVATLDVKADAKAWGKAHGKKGEPAPVAPESLEWGLNAPYVRDALASLTGPDVTLGGMDSASPFRVSCADDERRLVVLMPLRV
jgi:DNA polymerase-3 subunit beta